MTTIWNHNLLNNNLNITALTSGFWYTISNILIRSTALITAPIFTRLLSTSDYGIASNFLAWVAIVSVLTGLGLPYTIGNANIDFKSDLGKYIASIQVLGSISALIFLIFGVFYSQQLAYIMLLDSELVLLLFIYLLFYPSVLLVQEKYKYELKYKQNIMIAIVNSLGAILFCLMLMVYVFDDQRYFGRVIGLILPMFFIGAFYYFKNIGEVKFQSIQKYWSYALKISLPMVPHSLAMIVLTQIDRIMIIRFTGNSEAGLFSFGFNYAVLILIITNAVLQGYIPWLYSNYEKNDLSSIRKSSKMITLIMCVITIILITIGPEILSALGTKEFMDAKWVITPIALGALFQFVYNNYSSLELYHKKTKIIAFGTILTALVNFGLNYTFIPIYGYYAAGYTTFMSYLFLALFHLFAHRKICNRIVFNDGFIWTVTLSTSILAIMITLVYPYIFLRYLFLFVFLLTLIIVFKNQILYLLNLFKQSMVIS